MSPRVITPVDAHAAGISPAALRLAAGWNVERAAAARARGREADRVRIARCTGQAIALVAVAAEVERLAGRKSRRRAA